MLANICGLMFLDNHHWKAGRLITRPRLVCTLPTLWWAKSINGNNNINIKSRTMTMSLCGQSCIQFNDPIREQSGKRASKKGLGFSWKDARSWIIRRGYYDVMGGWRGGGGRGYQGGQQETWTNKVIHSDHHCCFNDIYRVIIQKTPKCLCGKTWWKCV